MLIQDIFLLKSLVFKTVSVPLCKGSDWSFSVTVLGQTNGGQWLKYTATPTQYAISSNKVSMIFNGQRATSTFSRKGSTLVLDGENWQLVSGALLSNLNSAIPCDANWNPLQ